MVDQKVHGQWYALITDKFMPLLKSQPLFKKVVFSKVLSASAEEHYTYSILIEIETMEGYELYQNEILTEYIEIAQPMFESKAIHFVTVMKSID